MKVSVWTLDPKLIMQWINWLFIDKLIKFCDQNYGDLNHKISKSLKL